VSRGHQMDGFATSNPPLPSRRYCETGPVKHKQEIEIGNLSIASEIQWCSLAFDNILSYEYIANGSSRHLELVRSVQSVNEFNLRTLEYFFHDSPQAPGAVSRSIGISRHASFCNLPYRAVRELEDDLIETK
jgi:hypothetical protein